MELIQKHFTSKTERMKDKEYQEILKELKLNRKKEKDTW